MENNINNWNKEEESYDLIEIVLQYLKYWKWFVISVFVFLLIGVFIILKTEKEYDISLSILLNESNSSNMSGSALMNLESLGLFSTTNNIDNEVAILTSPDLMEKVVKELNLNISYFTHKGLRSQDVFQESPIHARLENSENPNFIEKVDFSVTKQSESDYIIEGKLTLDVSGDKVEFEKEVTKFPAVIDIQGTVNYKLLIDLTGKKFEEDIYYVKINTVGSTMSSLCSNLTVAPTSKISSVLRLSLPVNNKKKGATILQTLIRQYNILQVEDNNKMAYRTSLFINSRLDTIAKELKGVEYDVVEYKQKNNISDLAAETQMYMQQTGENEKKRLDVEIQLNVVSLVNDFINDRANEFKLIPNLGIADQTLAQTITEYNNKLLSYERLIATTSEASPFRIRLKEELEKERSSISDAVVNVKRSYSLTLKDIKQQRELMYSKIQSMPKQQQGLVERVREQQIKEGLFLFLMQKREETNITMASTADKAKIIASPQLDQPASAPRIKLILIIAVLLGVLFPVAFIYIRHLFKTQIGSRDELEKLSKVKVLGQICRNDSEGSIAVYKNSNTPSSELFRYIRNSINFIFRGGHSRIILVTSTMAGEGKTYISINLSLSYALTNKKVLLIGADIRNPRLNNHLDLNAKRGLTGYLSDENSDWRDFVKVSKENENLHVLVGGAIPPNPNELLMSDRMINLLDLVRAEYDYVIIDSAPVGIVSDTFLLADYVDLTLYVVRENKTPKNTIGYINLLEEQGRLKNLYLILNDSSNNGNFKYGYGKAYGYEHQVVK